MQPALKARRESAGFLPVQVGLGSLSGLPVAPVAIRGQRADLNSVLRGWAYSCAYGTRLRADRAVDHYVSEGVPTLLAATATRSPRAARALPL